MSNMMTFTANVNTATMKLKKWEGRDFLVGPVVMAREIVMNGLLYPSKELKMSVLHWNGRPVVVNHPKDAKGSYISANSPEIIEKCGLGFVFNTLVDAANRLKAELWLDVAKLKEQPSVNKKVEDGEMLEVSTGLFVSREEEAGNFNGKDYEAIARNHKPDHLALLPDTKGACSVEDGAGFPRANEEMLEACELSGGEKMTIVGRSLRRKFNKDGNWAYLVDLYEDYVVFEQYVPNEGYNLYRVSYEIGANEQTVTLGAPTRVVLQKTYVDAVEANMLKTTSTKGTAAPQGTPETQTNGDKRMNEQEKINKLLADKLIDANEAKTLSSMTDEQFAVYEKAHTPPHKAAETLSDDEKDDGEDDEEEAGDGIEDNKKSKKPLVPPAPEKKPEGNADEVNEWARKNFAKVKGERIASIMANKANTFTKAQLEGMKIDVLEGMSALASNADMTAAQTPATGAKTEKPEGNTKKIIPYVPEHMRKKATK